MDHSESNSIKSVNTSIKTSPKKVNFTSNRPKLVIPPPQGFLPQYATGTAGSYSASAAGYYPDYFRKQSAFLFDQLHGIKDLTKSGLGFGEKSAFWLYNKIKRWSRRWFTHMFLTIILILYTIGGAFIFEAVEGAHEAAKKNQSETFDVIDVRSSRIKLIRDLRDLSLNTSSDDEWMRIAGDFFEKHKSVLIANEQKKREMEKEHKKKWSFSNAVVYCGTVYTSIGYGHIYPETASGKAITIVYAIIGLPLFLIALTDFGKLFTRCIKFFWSYVRRVYYTGSCRKVRKTAHVEDIFKGAQKMYEIATFRRPSDALDPENPQPMETPVTPVTPAISNYEIDDEFNLPITLAITILIIYILLGAMIYCVWEDWNFFDSFYFVFISMTTVGFGDMVPDDPACMIVSIVYLVFGLALMSMCINVVQVKLSDTFKQASSKLGASIGITIAEDDGSVHTVPPDNVELAPVHQTPKEKEENTKEEEENTK